MKGIFILTINVNWFLIIFFISYSHWNFANALVGENVRAARENEFGFAVSISGAANPRRLSRELLHKCSGTLVSRQDVLTAEHCVQNVLPSSIKILAGSIDLTQAQVFSPMFYISYEQWAIINNEEFSAGENDIAFIKIIGNVPDTIPIASLGNAPNEALAGLEVQIAGWGKLMNDTIPRILQTVNVRVLSKMECQGRIFWYAGYMIFLDERSVCTTAQPYALMNAGDSGGPVLLHGSLIAVNKGLIPSYDETIHPEQTNFHTGVRYYYNFIAHVLTNSVLNF